VALATCDELPDGDEDAPALTAALRTLGVEAVSVTWDADDVDWGEFDLVVVRSTWDYAERYEQFLAWLEIVPRLANPSSVVRWSTDKRYLAELAAAGVAVAPTEYLDPGDPFDPPSGRFVVKPAVSAGGRHAASYRPEATASAVEHVRRLHGEGRTVIVQPYLDALDADGETGLVFIAGRYSHAFRKGPLLAREAEPATGLYLEEEIEPRAPSSEEHEAAARALAAVPFDSGEILYARVDLAPTENGRPVVLEVELAEPSLYLWCRKGAAERFAEAISAVATLSP
jgi:glutathione synthase/RimK-type ligase-like ATP-grasp enzyme